MEFNTHSFDINFIPHVFSALTIDNFQHLGLYTYQGPMFSVGSRGHVKRLEDFNNNFKVPYYFSVDQINKAATSFVPDPSALGVLSVNDSRVGFLVQPDQALRVTFPPSS